MYIEGRPIAQCDSHAKLVSTAMNSATLQVLTEAFGFTRFREGQEEIIETILGRQDVLAVMPTGSGKSLCYQLPALLLPGTTLVVSPLIALMQDQVDTLVRRGIPASFVNSTLNLDQQLFVTGFDRPNLCFRVQETPGEQEKLEAIRTLLQS